MEALAVLLNKPRDLALAELALTPAAEADVVVETAWTGISTGTEKLLWSGRMPDFPGMGYPLVPGYESVGRVVEAGALSGRTEGDFVFVPGANCFPDARGLFGGAASRLVTAGARTVPVPEALGPQAVLLALAATAHHAVAPGKRPLPELIVGHGVLGRLIARIAVALGGAPTVWETSGIRLDGADGYRVCRPEADERRDYSLICDASGDAGVLDTLIVRLGRGGEIVLAGFYDRPVSFAFPPAFLREATLRIAAEWRPDDMAAVSALVGQGKLSLDGLITHCRSPERPEAAYEAAFVDPGCLKMVLDWRQAA